MYYILLLVISLTHLLNKGPRILVFLETYNTEFDDNTITLMDQNGRLLEIEVKISLTLLNNKQK